MNEGNFYRLPKDVIQTELFVARQKLNQFTDRVTSGNDVDQKELESVIKMLKDVSSHIKKFSKAEEVIGTVYESEVSITESLHLKESFEDFLNEESIDEAISPKEKMNKEAQKDMIHDIQLCRKNKSPFLRADFDAIVKKAYASKTMSDLDHRW
jgi:predicted thioredoxin/glutaredoxin